MKNQLQTPNLFDASVEAYGPQGAYDIMAAIRDSIGFTNDTLRPEAPIATVGIGIVGRDRSDVPFKVRGIHSEYAGIEIQLGRTSAAEIVPLIPVTVLHEGGHVLRNQLMAEAGECGGDTDESTLFEYVIDEGLSVLAEAVILDEWSHTSCIKMTTKDLRAGLATVLHAGVVSHEAAYDFIERDDNQGYRIGHYAVTAMAYCIPDLFELFKLPYAEYHALAKELVG